jgi:hypothetical protein
MKQDDITSTNFLNSEGKKRRSQLQIVDESFLLRPSTRLMIARATGIDRGNICYYVGMLREAGRITVVKHGLCLISKHQAEYLTTDPALMPQDWRLF